MSDRDVPPIPPTCPADEARTRLAGAGFKRLHINAKRLPRCELWQNRHGKNIAIDYTDSTFSLAWVESLESALNARDSIPARPFASLWATIFGAPKPEK